MKLEKQLLELQKQMLENSKEMNKALKKLEEQVNKMSGNKEKCWSPKRVADVKLKEKESVRIDWGGYENLEIIRIDDEIVIEKWSPITNGEDDFDWDFEELISFKI